MNEKGDGRNVKEEIGGDAVEKSRPMLAWITSFVKYYYSTSIYRNDIICSKDFAKRRKQRGRAHCASLQWLRSYGMRRASAASQPGAGMPGRGTESTKSAVAAVRSARKMSDFIRTGFPGLCRYNLFGQIIQPNRASARLACFEPLVSRK